MADDVTVDNGTLTDYNVRSTEVTGGKQIQHVRLDLGSGTSEDVAVAAVPVSGTVTANLGTVGGLATETTLAALDAKVTAVNTGAVVVSSSALPTGAATFTEQQTQTASLSVLDDWDESDRAKVNTKVSTGTPSVSSVTTIGTTAALSLTSEPCAFLEISGTYTSISLTFEARAIGGSAYQAIKGYDTFAESYGTSTTILSNVQRRFYFNTEGFDSIQCRVLSYGSGAMDTRWIPVNTNGPFNASYVLNAVSATITGTTFTDSFGNSGPGDGVQIGFIDTVVGDYQRQSGSSGAAWTNLRDENGSEIGVSGSPVNTADTRTAGSAQQVQGPLAVGALSAGANPLSIAFQDIFGTVAIPTGIDAGGLKVLGVVPLDLSLNIQDFSAAGEVFSLGAATANSSATARYIACDASGNIGANPTTANGKTMTYVPVAQGAAGTTVLAAALASNKHKIVGCSLTLSAAGTLKFLDGSGDLTGAMDISATGGFVWPTSVIPYQQTATNSALSITTTGGAAKGVVIILTEA
jgi:hypothetical protein